ncbi:N-terminal acetyltransferase A, auxiliary subunit [Gloeophyllum trabeum ATCC 11539]|uniref:N-terminal acetyltransferase A, auxiliary subunit n=1 Tax=Gloeophyllum trabeum (strain ATCC 11539 / FP-39264 / Madison 617) TaxID=670483 RepID=S7Q210_GLOTA|nr:N-terminal acetyltransferase A, auxiliary subunit [Gloeophyllum trabeum ATCC 11539]EPQ53593.1 N-terminal acetyltransferase A, auxiliary subunit [Gloeophyllum trabeum ATCC 11539]
MPPPGVPAKRQLPSKEQSLFKELLTLYETRQLKKGIKTADQILKKFPEHGETLCMKGLLLTHLGRREEGREAVKTGLRMDLTSHICWHVFGLIQKGERNYEEALKSYTQALRFDKENLNILRDAANLQTQLRLYDGLVETRHTLLRLRPQLRQNWIALAVAYHLNGQLSDAKQVLEAYEKTLKNVPDYDVEHSEVLLYHVRLLEDLDENSEALSLLDTSAKSRAIVDRKAIMEYRARLLSKLGQTDEAEHAWRALIEQNPDCIEYYKGYLSNRGISFDSLTDETRAEAARILRDFSQQIPRGGRARHLALTVSTGDEFKELVKEYITSGLSKGIPSLFADLKTLYKNPAKQEAIEETVEEIRGSLSSAPSEAEPTMYLWTLYFLAQHHSFLGRQSRALSLLEEAFKHTPTLPELYTCKARVLKRSGDYYGAAKSLNDARLLDGQDRFLNTKCGKYRLRAGLIEEASEIFGLFTKKDAASPAADLEDMQSLLFLVEDGDAYNRNGNLGMALKRYHAVQKVFDEYEDDQFDFHSYSIRKFTINVYLEMIHWEDQLRSNPAYVHAALAASQVYIRLHDDPALVASLTAPAALSDAEKKAKNKAKKAKAAQKQEEAKKASSSQSNEDKGLEPAPPQDEDPHGTKLVEAADRLDKAAAWLKPLQTLAKDNIDVWIAVYDVAVRRDKHLQAIKALSHARQLDPENPELHLRLIDARKRALPSASAPALEPVVSASLQELIPDTVSLETYNSQYLQRHSTSPKAILASARALRRLEAPVEEIENTVFSLLNAEIEVTVKTALAALAFLQEIQAPRAEEFRTTCDAKFELSTAFKSSEELAALRRCVINGTLENESAQPDAEVLS